MWSATWPQEVQSLARTFCRDSPLKVQTGKAGSRANPDITQEVRVVTELDKRQRFFEWLTQVSPDAASKPRILVFVDTKRSADALCRELKYERFNSAAIHGDKDQRERDAGLHNFRNGQTHILVATDVAQRGLDIKDIEYVVNYDVPKTIEDYIHRIGRTGRAGAGGTAVTFFGCDGASMVRMAQSIIQVMEDVGQVPPDALRSLTQRW